MLQAHQDKSPIHISASLTNQCFDSRNLARAMPLPFSAFRELLARQRGPLEHRALGALTRHRAAHLLALTTASRPSIPVTAEACLGTGKCQRRAQSYRENEKGERYQSKIQSHNLILGVINFGAKALQFFLHTPSGLAMILRRKTKEGSLKGPRLLGIIDDAEWPPWPRSGRGVS